MLVRVACDHESCTCRQLFPIHHSQANEVLIESAERSKSDFLDTFVALSSVSRAKSAVAQASSHAIPNANTNESLADANGPR